MSKKTNKVTEIFNAWKVAKNPTDNQQEIAEERLETCNSCEFKREQPLLHCGACGCPLQKKAYSQVARSCPKGKWLR